MCSICELGFPQVSKPQKQGDSELNMVFSSFLARGTLISYLLRVDPTSWRGMTHGVRSNAGYPFGSWPLQGRISTAPRGIVSPRSILETKV